MSLFKFTVKWPEFMTPYDRDALNLGDVVSWCWPNAKISYPDFLNDKTHDWWYESFLEFTTNKVNGTNMAGIWIVIFKLFFFFALNQ